MTRGRKPIPTALKILAGNPSHRPLNLDEPQPEASIPQPPSQLSGDALVEWDRIVPELHALGLLTEVDRAALALYCVSYGRWMEAERQLSSNGLTVLSPSGYEQKSPWLTIADKAMEQLRRFISEFGLSPASRTRVSATPPSDDDDFFENA